MPDCVTQWNFSLDLATIASLVKSCKLIECDKLWQASMVFKSLTLVDTDVTDVFIAATTRGRASGRVVEIT